MLSLFCILALFACHVPCCAEEATTASPEVEASAQEATGNERPRVTYHDYSIEADYIKGESAGEVDAVGQVIIVSSDGIFATDRAHYNLMTQSGHLENASGLIDPFRFKAKSVTIDEDHGKQIREVSLTTCTREHPHYELLTQDLLISQDEKVQARRIALVAHGHKLFTLPGFRGSLKDSTDGQFKPTVVVGLSGIDGAYVGANYDYPLGKEANLLVTGRIGTRGIPRGGVYLSHPFNLGALTKGEVSLVATHREDVDNSLMGTETVDGVRLKDLTVSRLPAVQVALDPITLPAPLGGTSLLIGGGFGRYQERPTDVTENRGQVWAIVRNPIAHVGPVRVYGEYGMRRAYYPGDTHQASVLSLTAENDPKSDSYYHVSYRHRKGHGESPFLFDRVLVPNELYTEVEVPLTKKGQWRLGAQTRYDLDDGRFRNYDITAIYRQDCLSYGLTYNHASRSVGVGMVINAFGSFRKGASSINFAQ